VVKSIHCIHFDYLIRTHRFAFSTSAGLISSFLLSNERETPTNSLASIHGAENDDPFWGWILVNIGHVQLRQIVQWNRLKIHSVKRPCRHVNLSVFDDFCLRSSSVKATVCYRPTIEWSPNGTWWWASIEISRMEIDQSKLSCPIAPVFLEWDMSPLKTLATIAIRAGSQGRR
jgi:hypothetical protein